MGEQKIARNSIIAQGKKNLINMRTVPTEKICCMFCSRHIKVPTPVWDLTVGINNVRSMGGEKEVNVFAALHF